MTEADITKLLGEREGHIEFKPALLERHEIAEYAVGIGNIGGGHLIMGVSDARPRKFLGIAPLNEKNVEKLQQSVAEAADIHVVVENVRTREGTIVVVSIPPRPRGVIFHTKTGKYLTRVGGQLRGMTLDEIDAIRRESGVELTANPVPGAIQQLVSGAGMEELRALMQEASAPKDLLALNDTDLLKALGVVSEHGQLLTAGLILVGTGDALRQHLPAAGWSFRRMISDTDYDISEDGLDCLPIALRRMRDLVGANNPVVTIPGWLVHPEFPRYPTLALRELLINALVHRDLTAPGVVMIKLYPDRLELSNPGGFVDGVSVQNILHHPSAPRYRTLFQALVRVRLANATNLGVPRVYRELLGEGKEPPSYWAAAGSVRVTVRGQEAKREFLELVRQYPDLDVDHLLIVHYLTRHREITAKTMAAMCQRQIEDAREILAHLSTRYRLVERGGTGAGRYYRLSRATYELLVPGLGYHVDRRLSFENAKARVLSALEDGPLSNAGAREVTQLSRTQCMRLLSTLRKEGIVVLEGTRRGSRWVMKKGS
ncbi:MAG: putative DNA binding domain-containing protein [Deltaproteobacteria bacterium]|nr:putative DNA binding domain-containing protein [Deltaproteobacteria bacterium]